MHSFENNNCSYTEHMQSIIDHLTDLQTSDQGPGEPDKIDTETQICNSSDRHLKQEIMLRSEEVVSPCTRPVSTSGKFWLFLTIHRLCVYVWM